MENFQGQKEVELLKELSLALNKPLYIVGGYVRNALGGLQESECDGACDIDICSDFDADEFLRAGAKITPINKRLGTSKVDYKGFSYEYTRFRAESYNEGGHHTPSEVDFVSDLSLDALRRDFTINSIYYDVANNKIIDPLNGAADVKNKTIRCHNPESVFSADGLRLLRLCRFAAQTGYKIDAQTLKAAKKFRANLKDIAKERKREELDKILIADTKYGVKNAHYRGLKLLTRLNLWEFLMPPLVDMDIPQNPNYHLYSVLEHTFKAVKYVPPHLRLAALLHDVGKPISLKLQGNMHSHAALGAQAAEKILADLSYPLRQIEKTKKLIELHMFDLKRDVRDNKMLLFAAENFDLIDDLQALVLADSKATGKKLRILPRFAQFKNQLIAENAPLTVKQLEIDGTDCVNAGLEGAKIGETLELLWRECVMNPQLNNREWLLAQLKLKF